MAKIDLRVQLKRRVDALEGLLDLGQPLPGNASPPTSMAQARAWVEPELGIEEIASKSSTNQRQHKNEDDLLISISKLKALTDRCLALKQSKKRAPKPKPEDASIKLRKENIELKTREEALSNRLHEVEQALSTLKTSHENQQMLLAKSTELVANLRRQINASAKANAHSPHLSLASNETD